MRGILLSPATAERGRVQEILRRAGHSIQATDDHEDALDLVIDAKPRLVAIAVDSEGNAANTVKMIKVMTAGWAHDIKIIAIGEGAHDETVDAVVAAVPHEEQLLGAVELLFRKAPFREQTSVIPRAHLPDIARSLGVDFAEEYVANSFQDIDLQIIALEAEIFRRNPRNVNASLRAIEDLALNIDGRQVASLCRQWRAEEADRLLEALPHIVQNLRHALPHAKAEVSEKIAALSQLAPSPES